MAVKELKNDDRYVLPWLTSPLGHEGVYVSQKGEDVERLVETRLVPVQRDHQRPLGRAVAQPSVTCSGSTEYKMQISEMLLDLTYSMRKGAW